VSQYVACAGAARGNVRFLMETAMINDSYNSRPGGLPRDRIRCSRRLPTIGVDSGVGKCAKWRGLRRSSFIAQLAQICGATTGKIDWFLGVAGDRGAEIDVEGAWLRASRARKPEFFCRPRGCEVSRLMCRAGRFVAGQGIAR